MEVIQIIYFSDILSVPHVASVINSYCLVGTRKACRLLVVIEFFYFNCN